jgi:hypothetical protein
MKKLILILCLILAFSSYSQTRTKKYNSLQERYEYFENGRMVGYEKYNSLRKQWEYYSTKKSSSNSYSDRQSNFDVGLARMALEAKQNRYDNEKEIVEQNMARLSELQTEISEHAYNINDTNKRDQIIELYNEKYKRYYNKKYPNKEAFVYVIKSFNLTTAMLNDIVVLYNSSFKEVMSKPEKRKTSRSKSYMTTIKSDVINPKLRLKPNVNSQVIYEPNNGEKVEVFNAENETYYSVRIGSYIGYISKGNLN